MDEQTYASDDGERLWSKATHFNEITELTALYFEGELSYFPLDARKPAGETHPVNKYLAAFNWAGYWTLCSQPGALEAFRRQRAFVDGFASREIAQRLERLTLHSDLITMVYPPESMGGYLIPTVVREFQPHGWAGPPRFETIELLAGICRPELIAQLSELWSVTIIDPSWGRADYLWETIAKELCYDAAPHPDLGEDGEFPR